MIKLIWDKRFKRNLKKYISKHPEMEDKIKDKLKLFTENPYAPELRNHKLSGQLKDLRAIVIDYDCRIVFRFVEKNSVLLISIGTHDEVY
jgi:addiction module RelE/StbE family toxin